MCRGRNKHHVERALEGAASTGGHTPSRQGRVRRVCILKTVDASSSTHHTTEKKGKPPKTLQASRIWRRTVRSQGYNSPGCMLNILTCKTCFCARVQQGDGGCKASQTNPGAPSLGVHGAYDAAHFVGAGNMVAPPLPLCPHVPQLQPRL